MSVHAKKYGETWVYFPLPCMTGALHAQPASEVVRLDACLDFTPDYKVMFDMRGALDAPNTIPRGGVRAQDFEPDASAGRLLVGHVYRDGWHS
jgi:hypothetical protein